MLCCAAAYTPCLQEASAVHIAHLVEREQLTSSTADKVEFLLDSVGSLRCSRWHQLSQTQLTLWLVSSYIQLLTQTVFAAGVDIITIITAPPIRDVDRHLVNNCNAQRTSTFNLLIVQCAEHFACLECQMHGREQSSHPCRNVQLVYRFLAHSYTYCIMSHLRTTGGFALVSHLFYSIYQEHCQQAVTTAIRAGTSTVHTTSSSMYTFLPEVFSSSIIKS